MENNNEKNVKYKPVNIKNNESSFGKQIVFPFISGVLGATLVVGTCFGIPGIKTKLIGSTNSKITSTQVTSPVNNTVNIGDYSGTAINVANKVLPSIVGIKVEYSVNSIFYSHSSTATASGSGIIISKDGYILTNNHIVDTSADDSFYSVSEANKVTVKLYNDDTEYEAKIVGTDAQTDLAVIKLDKDDLIPAELGDSDSVQVGEFAMAIGTPLNLGSSVTCGIISAKDRNIKDSEGKYTTLIQTDAAINSGNSGGALVNADGKVIGLNTLKIASTGVEGMGFAIPINSTIDIYNQLIEYNKVKRPYIGITGIDLDEKRAQANNLVKGIYVKSIDEFSAAEKAGLKIGDVIIKADDKDISTMKELNDIKNSHQIGDSLTLKINRDGKELDLTVILQEAK